MNSLEDLNDYSDEQLTVPDDRPFDITYSDETTQDYILTINEGEQHIMPCPIDISGLISAQNVTYTVTFNYDGSTAMTGMSVDNYRFTQASTYVWSAPIVNLTDWSYVKTPNIIPPADLTFFSYTVTLSHPTDDDGSTTGKTWTVSVNVNNASEITTPVDEDYDEDFPLLLTGYPQVTNDEDTNPSSVYTVEVFPTLTAAVSTLSSAGSGGTSSFNSGTKKLTLVGTKTQVNSHLAAITLTPATDYAVDFVLNYRVTNPISSLQTTVTQNLLISGFNSETSNLNINRSYTENKVNTLFLDADGSTINPPQIIEDVYGSPTYTVTLTLGASIGEISIGDGIGWDAGTKTYSFSGTKAQCNTKLYNLVFIPIKDTYTSSTLRYRQYRDSVLQTDNTVTFTGVHNTTPVAGAGVYVYDVVQTTRTQDFSITFDQAKFLNCDILIIGGGGAGGNTYKSGATSGFIGGGGGAGGVYSATNTTLFRDNVSYLGTNNFRVRVGYGANYQYLMTNGDGVISWGYTAGYGKIRLTTSTNICTTYDSTGNLKNHNLNNGDLISFQQQFNSSGGTTSAPTYLSLYTAYYVINATANTFQISTSVGGSAVTFASNSQASMLQRVAPATFIRDTEVYNSINELNGEDTYLTKLSTNTELLRAYGGGSGQGFTDAVNYPIPPAANNQNVFDYNNIAQNGGSGGGCNSESGSNAGTGVSGQGYAGGVGNPSSTYNYAHRAGGGGGAGGVGSTSNYTNTGTQPRNGGDGFTSSISGSSITYAVGGNAGHPTMYNSDSNVPKSTTYGSGGNGGDLPSAVYRTLSTTGGSNQNIISPGSNGQNGVLIIKFY